ncbi:acrosomal protein KIAA1210 homolog [Microcaecilia unicolor]|uniref:Acrosomal protein KIAA1210 homolog n=1 Tax=Microcaecilia unicolor TaxID=1415580 RepID=A0A6P7YDZ3_9AMPH|nr:acrosomal protein KIAA1210 homolog [Microcaecilia unicolor]
MAGFYSCLKGKNDYIMARETREKRLPETDDTGEESSGKKKSKFQTFKNFFAKKKKKERPADSEESNLKPSQSSSDVSAPEPNAAALHLATKSGTKGNMGNKARSHDSVFISEPALENEAGDRLSQENITGNVKALQLQLKQNIRVGSPPQVITSGKSEDIGTVSEDDGLPRSPPEISTLQEILTCTLNKSSNPVQRHSSLSLGGTDTEDEQVSSEASSRPVSPLSSIVLVSSASVATSESPVDFSVPANPLACLDSSAARHRIAINPRKQRGPVNRSKLRPEQEPKANVLSVSVSLEGENDAIQLISVEQSEEDQEGSSMAQVEKNDKEIHIATESTDFMNNSAMSSCQNLVSPITDRALAHAKVCPEDSIARNNDLLSSSYVQCNLTEEQKANRDEENQEVEPKAEQPTHVNVIELVKPVETDNEIKCQDSGQEMDPRLLNTTFKEKEDTCAEDTLTSLPKSVNQTEDEPCHSSMAAKERDEFLSWDNENTSITFGLNSSSSNLQAQLSTLETSTETISTIKEDSVIQPQISEAHQEPEVILQTDMDMGDLDLNQLLIKSKIPEELHLVRELQSSLSQGSSEDKYVNPGADSSSSEEQKIFASIPILNAECSSVAASKDEEQLDIVTAQVMSSKTNKIAEENLSHQKCTGKPVRFTIASAWQRSLSGGLSSKEETHSRNLALAIKPELFEGTGNEDAEKEKMRPKSAIGNQDDIDHEHIEFPFVKQTDIEAQNPETPFGIRLRRTSSLIRYSEERCTESQKAGSPATYPSPSLQDREIQKSPAPVKLSNDLPTSAKLLNKESSLQEEKPPQKQKQRIYQRCCPLAKPQVMVIFTKKQRVLNASGAEAVSEPAWVSMAKLKQKGFKGHPLAKEQTTENRAVAETDREKRTNCTDENTVRENLVSDPLGMEKSQSELPAVSIAAAPGGLECPTVNLAPVTENDGRLSSSLPVTQNSSAEPPWMSLAKKKHKAWSEMPQIVQ